MVDTNITAQTTGSAWDDFRRSIKDAWRVFIQTAQERGRDLDTARHRRTPEYGIEQLQAQVSDLRRDLVALDDKPCHLIAETENNTSDIDVMRLELINAQRQIRHMNSALCGINNAVVNLTAQIKQDNDECFGRRVRLNQMETRMEALAERMNDIEGRVLVGQS